jgi:hypothetical protein
VSCLTEVEPFDHGGLPMTQFAFRFLDLAVVTLLFTAFT